MRKTELEEQKKKSRTREDRAEKGEGEISKESKK
jgi:hypothetical protein